MTERLKGFIQSIKDSLKEWPENDINEAISFYEEFIEDALEEGLSEDEIISRLGMPDSIVKTIKAESRIENVEKRPGPLNLLKSFIAMPALKTSIFIGGIVSFLIAFMLYALAFVSYMGIAGGILIAITGIKQISPDYSLGIIGMVGLAFSSTAIFGITGYLIWKIANILSVRTMHFLRRGIKTQKISLKKDTTASVKSTSLKSKSRKKVITIFLILFITGFILIIPSGLAQRYFSIWNSMRPVSVTVKKSSFSANEIKAIDITTMNSMVVIERNIGNDIQITYEEPDWLSGNLEKRGEIITFKETPNGRLPFMNFISRHEGITTVKVSLPENTSVTKIEIKSNGGNITVKGLETEYSISVKAGNRKIRYKDMLVEKDRFERKGNSNRVIDIETGNGFVIIE